MDEQKFQKEESFAAPDDYEFELRTPEPKKWYRLISIRNAIIIGIVVIIVALGFAARKLVVAATVNGRLISRLTVIRSLEKKSGKAVLDSLIVEKLIEQEADKKGVKISDSEVSDQIKTIEAQITGQGGTLDAALSAQGVSREDLMHQIIIQKKVEKLLADKIQVSDAEIEKYIKDNAVKIPKGQEQTFKSQIAGQLRNQKLSQEAGAWINTLRNQATIRYFVQY